MVRAQSPADATVARPRPNRLGGLAAWCYDHRRAVLLGWVLAVVAVIALAALSGSRLDNNFALSSAPSQQAQHLLASRFPALRGDSADVVLQSPGPLTSPANAASIDRLVKALRLFDSPVTRKGRAVRATVPGVFRGSKAPENFRLRQACRCLTE
jgi:uncharacterized membrane protein YdfJ with MMPL/SSD domain